MLNSKLLVALDTPTLPEALALVAELRGLVGGFKVGLELCSAVGVPTVVAAIAAAGGSVFLDLKLKDIPNTVAGAVRAIGSNFGGSVRMLTLHCDGGGAMLRAAVDANQSVSPRPLLLGVTVLTSMDAPALAEVGVADEVESQVLRLARLAQASGLDGVVASPHEVAAIKAACGPGFLVVTPGVRPPWASSADQRRVMTPAEAVAAGADYLVIGRPITAPPAEIGGSAAAARRVVGELGAESG
ncbi:MAG: orotidine-5'-phosphate decarboxylase [Chloroflexaceae bacterium]|jgi:orotidine-5'-phosphate decarboxylase|nr:orotidine-5'-phosphate decarboxylase [Chloroflexaceae bacterium]